MAFFLAYLIFYIMTISIIKSTKIYQKTVNVPVTDLFNLLKSPLVELRSDSAFFFSEKDTKYLSRKKTVKETSCV